MLIYDVLHKEKVYRGVANDLRNLGVKHRLKKNAVKNEKAERSRIGRKVFKVPLSYQPLDVVSLVSGAIVHVPNIVSQATTYLENFLHHEGLFRKAGSHTRQKELIARLDAGGTLGDKNHAIDVANCLKTFFRDLPEPLIPFAFHDLFVRCIILRPKKIDALLLACLLLPPHHLNTLAYFMEFLKKVSSFENLNKMSMDNLATVIAPNIMPLQETTMSAVQSRLNAHLLVVKILIENAEKIGVLPDHISEAIAAEVSGSAETELDHSDPGSRSRNKKKKHRSGSLTRMFHGLKKIVGRNGSPIDAAQSNNQLVPAPLDPSHTPSIKVGKKRKVVEPIAPLSVKKKREILDSMPDRTNHHSRPLLLSPVSHNPNPVRERSPVHKSKVRKYLTHKVPSEIRVFDKVDKPKKLRMSLDRFVSRSKQKVADVEPEESCQESYSPYIERRWSSASNASAAKKNRVENVENNLTSPSMRKATTLSNVRDEYDGVFMDADVNLSDDCETMMKTMQSTNKDNKTVNFRGGNCRRSFDPNLLTEANTNNTPKHNKHLRSLCRRFSAHESPNSLTPLDTSRNTKKCVLEENSPGEDYVKISKSEYEEIKSRVSAIESCISQEFCCIANEIDATETLSATTSSSVSKVQSKYEKAMMEANLENTITADNLAKRLSKELKIRRSSEHKIIRSPSARKIGILRRRSQEKVPSKRVSRNSSCHLPQRTDNPRAAEPSASNGLHVNQSINQSITIYQSPKIMRARKLEDYYPEAKTNSLCSDETNARLDDLHEQLHTLITHTAEHTRGSSTDEEISYDDDIFPSANKSAPHVRRASSFHGNEFIENSRYFNNRVKELKKTNSHQNVATQNEPRNPESPWPVDVHRSVEKTKPISWKDAANYFKSDVRSNAATPVQQTGRASIAKLRMQNAGMVLAKAKLFDENETRKIATEPILEKKMRPESQQTPPLPPKLSRCKELNNPENDMNSPRKSALIRRKQSKSPKNNAKLRLTSSANSSPRVKMEMSISPNQGNSPQSGRRRRNCLKLEQENREYNRSRSTNRPREDDSPFALQREKVSRSPNKSCPNRSIQDPSLNVSHVDSACKTPHIKRALGTKTPKSARSLARRPIVETRRTPLKAVPIVTPKRQSPRNVLKSRQLSKPPN